MRFARCAGLAVCLITLPVRSLAAGFDLERLEIDPSAVGSLIVQSGTTLPEHGFRLGLGVHYQRDPLVVVVDGQNAGAVIRNRFVSHLFGAFGLTSSFELEFQIPIISYQRGQDLGAYSLTSLSSAGLATPFVSGRLKLLDQDVHPFDFAAELGVGVPIGGKDALGGDGRLSVRPRISAGRDFGEVRASTDLGVLVRPNESVGTDKLGSHFSADAALAYTGARLRPELIFRAAVPFTTLPAGFELLGGLRYALGHHIEAFALGGPGFGELIGTPKVRAMLGLAFLSGAPPAPAVSICSRGRPHRPEDCPDLDDDGDGILNKDDQCPLQKGVVEYHGCPIPDRDHDGVPDAEDRCPDEPGPKERAGCPFRDRDGHGVEDALDRCPDVPGPAENQGCPIKDRDGDGVPDDVDNCPDTPGPASNQGCPIENKQAVVITRERLVIKDKIYFDSGRATIQKKSYGLLKQVAGVLLSHPDLPLIRIEGHTDDRGGAAFNLKLSQDRAKAVRAFLITNGVAPEKLEALGYGLTQPIDSNRTASGRANNRRVEFTIVSPEPGAVESPSTMTRQKPAGEEDKR